MIRVPRIIELSLRYVDSKNLKLAVLQRWGTTLVWAAQPTFGTILMCDGVRARVSWNNPGKNGIKAKTRKSEKKIQKKKIRLGCDRLKKNEKIKEKILKFRRNSVNINSPLAFMAEETYNGAIGYIPRTLCGALT